jgi:hypothetical protein
MAKQSNSLMMDSITIRGLADEFINMLGAMPPSLWATWLVYCLEILEDKARHRRLMYAGENKSLGKLYDGGASYQTTLQNVMQQIQWRWDYGSWDS